MRECSKCRRCFEDDAEFCPDDGTKTAFTLTGSTIISGRYILDRRLGQGGMGIVFRAKHKFLKSFHAIKVILPSLVTDDENLLVRFNQEAVLAASIDHPNIIRVTDFGVENDTMPFLVMEFIDGTPLSQFLIQDKPIELSQALEYFLPIADAVAEAHRKGIVHRDLKPQNVMVQKGLPLKKAIKVLDFGLAKIKSADSYPSLIQANTMNIVGSPPYMSPEQWTGEGVDHRTDLYALGVLLFQMLTGHLPFKGDSMPAMMYQHLSGTPPTFASLNVPLTPDLEEVVQRALMKEPDKRHPTVEQMIGDLEAVVGRNSANYASTDIKTEVLPTSVRDAIARSVESDAALTDSQKKRFYSYFDSQHKPDLADAGLAQEFLEAQDEIESAKTEAINAAELVRELAAAQKEAEAAQNKALQAKQQIEANVRRQIEVEMERLEKHSQAEQEARAKQLADEVEARRRAEEKANYLAQAALEAQKLAESERQKREQESQQREITEADRRKAQVEAQELAAQVAQARKEYEEARAEASREAQNRQEAEDRQKHLEEELRAIAAGEAEQRRLAEARAKAQIKEQAEKYESEAQAARQRLDEARTLIETEAKKREAAEAARREAEQTAERLSQQIVEVQRKMEEMQQHITHETVTRSLGASGDRLQTVGTVSLPSIGSEPSSRKTMLAAGLASVVILVLATAGLGLYFYTRDPQAGGTGGEKPPAKPPRVERELVPITGGEFLMGRNDVPNKLDEKLGNQFPAHPEKVNSFLMDKYEVTNAQYADFVKARGHAAPPYWTNGEPPENDLNLPVTNVKIGDAQAYAKWLSERDGKTCRLPTEIEWEYAARNGASITTFPWGNDEKPEAAVLTGRAVAVGTSNDATPTGLRDMLGNVSEWTSSPYEIYRGHPSYPLKTEFFIIRGLNFSPDKDLIRQPNFFLTIRQYATNAQEYSWLGFRLVCEQ